MTGGAPLPVREYADGNEMLARYASIRQRTWAEKTVLPKVPAFKPQERQAASSISKPIPAPNRAVTLSAYEQAKQAAAQDQKTTIRMMRVVCAVSGLSGALLRSERRTAPIVKARHIAMYLMVRIGKRSLPEAGRAFGGRDHTTVLNGVRKVEKNLADLGLSGVTDPVHLADVLWRSAWTKAVR